MCEREREGKRDFNAIINLHISNCCHGTMLNTWHVISSSVRSSLPQNGNDFDFCTVSTYWILKILRIVIRLCRKSLARNWNSSHWFQVCFWEMGNCRKFSNLIENQNQHQMITTIISNDWVCNLHTHHQTHEYPSMQIRSFAKKEPKNHWKYEIYHIGNNISII